jgi:hypothetical protein
MTASERFGPRCRRLTLERTTSGAVDHACKSNPSFASEKSRNPFRPGGGKPSGVTIQRDDHLHTVGSFVPAVTDRVTPLQGGTLSRVQNGLSSFATDCRGKGARA